MVQFQRLGFGHMRVLASHRIYQARSGIIIHLRGITLRTISVRNTIGQLAMVYYTACPDVLQLKIEDRLALLAQTSSQETPHIKS